MNRHRVARLALLAAALALGPAMPAAAAVVIDKLTVRPMPARSAKEVPQEFEFEITIRDRGVARILGCDAMIEFGDGAPDAHQHFMDGGARKALVKHLYVVPGVYTVVARGRSVTGGRACDGEKRVEAVVGEPAAQRTTAPGEAPPVTSGCPAGFSLIPGSQSGYRYKCRAESATPKIQCQGDTKYFEQDGTIGCQ